MPKCSTLNCSMPSCTVTGEIGFSLKINVFKLTSGNTSPIIASSILNSALAHLPCSRALHVKCRLLPEDLVSRISAPGKLQLEMLSKVDNSTETPWDQGPKLALEGVFLATCVFGTL
jgi:hypothetical protein